MKLPSSARIATIATLLIAGVGATAHAEPGNTYNGAQCIPANPGAIEGFEIFGSLKVVDGQNHFVTCPLVKEDIAATGPMSVQMFARDARCVLRSTTPGSDLVVQGDGVDFIATAPATTGRLLSIDSALFGSVHIICRLSGDGEIRAYSER